MELQDHSDENGRENDREIAFFPNVLLSELSLAIAVIGLLTIFVSLFPLKLGEKFDPQNPPTLLEPEWYFMGVYQILKTQSVQPIHAIALSIGLGAFLLFVPFIDRSPERRPLRRPLLTSVAFVIIIEFLASTFYGYLSPGQVGTFSDSNFTAAFLTTNLLALALVAVVVAANQRIGRVPRS